MIKNWKKAFLDSMEKKAIMNAVIGGINVMTTMSDIKANKASTRLAAPTSAAAVGGSDPYSHQFRKSISHTPNRSLF